MKKSHKKYVVDTNVPLVANLLVRPAAQPEFPEDCQMKCADLITQIIREGTCEEGCVVIDAANKVLGEYGNKLSQDRREPGIGNKFLHWVSDHQYDQNKVCRVPLTKNNSSYQEFPHGPALAGFHKKDHKFVALANACNKTPVILQSTDRKWWKYKTALEQSGIKVRFLCPEFAKEKRAKKSRKPKI